MLKKTKRLDENKKHDEDRAEKPKPKSVALNFELPERSKIDRLLGYLSEFEKPDFNYGELPDGDTSDDGGTVIMRPPVYSHATQSFLNDCVESGILVMKAPEPTWGPRLPAQWNDLMDELRKDPEVFGTASMNALRVYMTAMFQFASVMPQLMLFEFKNGNMVRVLRRMRDLCGKAEG